MLQIKTALTSWTRGLRAMTNDEIEFDTDDGASLVEYILLVVGIALIAFASLRLIGPAIRSRFDDTRTEIESR